MRSKTPAIIFLLVCLCVILIWLSWRKHASDETTAPATNPSTRELVIQTGANGKTLKITDATNGVQNPTANVSPPDINRQLSNAIQDWTAKVQRPIEFYGKVVDENEQPLEGASIELIWTHVNPEGSFKTNLLSDVNGLFSLQNVTGAKLGVSVSKQGYNAVKSLNQKSFSYVALPGNEPFQPQVSVPIVFHLRKKGPGAMLITSQKGVSPYLQFSGPRDGSSQRVDFFSRNVGNEGQMELSSFKPPKTQERGPQAWSFRLSIPDGGFVEHNNELPTQAPESGYQPIVEFNFQPRDTNWTDVVNKHYYIVFGQPPVYGRLDLETGIYQGVNLNYAINPNGSRDLEPAEVTPPSRPLPPGVTEVIPKNTK